MAGMMRLRRDNYKDFNSRKDADDYFRYLRANDFEASEPYAWAETNPKTNVARMLFRVRWYKKQGTR